MGSKKRGGKMQSNEFYEKLEDGFLNPDDFTSDYSKSVSPTVEEMECPTCSSKRLIPCMDGKQQHCRDCGHIFTPKLAQSEEVKK